MESSTDDPTTPLESSTDPATPRPMPTTLEEGDYPVRLSNIESAMCKFEQECPALISELQQYPNLAADLLSGTKDLLGGLAWQINTWRVRWKNANDTYRKSLVDGHWSLKGVLQRFEREVVAFEHEIQRTTVLFEQVSVLVMKSVEKEKSKRASAGGEVDTEQG